MKTFIFNLCILLFMTACNGAKGAQPSKESLDLMARNAALESELKKIHDKDEADQRLGQYAINMMYKSPITVKELSPGMMLVLAQSIVRVGDVIFETEDHRHAFITAVKIESNFLKYAQSPTGPRGLSQVARLTFHEALADCGVTNLKDNDVWETELNLYAGACYFRKMLEMNNNDPYLAIVAYNQGPFSDSIKTFSKNGELHEMEPLRYVAKFTFLKRTTSDAKIGGVPSMSDLPRATPSSKPLPKVK